MKVNIIEVLTAWIKAWLPDPGGVDPEITGIRIRNLDFHKLYHLSSDDF